MPAFAGHKVAHPSMQVMHTTGCGLTQTPADRLGVKYRLITNPTAECLEISMLHSFRCRG